MKKVENQKLKNLQKKHTPKSQSLKFDDTEIEKHKFPQHKSPFLIDNIDTNKIVVSNKVSFGKQDFKDFIGYKNAKKVRFLCIDFEKRF